MRYLACLLSNALQSYCIPANLQTKQPILLPFGIKMAIHVIKQMRVDGRSSHQVAHGQFLLTSHHVQSSTLLEQCGISRILLYLSRHGLYGHLDYFLFHFS